MLMPLELCAPLRCPPAEGLCVPTAPSPCPPSLTEGPQKLVADGGRGRHDPSPGHANLARTQFRDCERSLPDPEVDHAQAEKEVAQAAPRFPVHSPC